MPPFSIGDLVEVTETVADLHPVTGDPIVIVESGWRGTVIGYDIDEEDGLMIAVEFFFGEASLYPESLRVVEPRAIN